MWDRREPKRLQMLSQTIWCYITLYLLSNLYHSCYHIGTYDTRSRLHYHRGPRCEISRRCTHEEHCKISCSTDRTLCHYQYLIDTVNNLSWTKSNRDARSTKSSQRSNTQYSSIYAILIKFTIVFIIITCNLDSHYSRSCS